MEKKNVCYLILLFSIFSVSSLIAHGEYQSQISYLKENGATPQEYILSKFENKDLVLLGEDHSIKQHVTFVKELIPALYKKGVHILCMEFGATEMQEQLDSLVTASQYDPDLARKMMFFYNTGWAYQEYMDIYYEVWKLNNSLSPGEKKFRIVNLSYRYDWSKYSSPRTPEVMAAVFSKGTPDKYRTDVIEKEVVSKGEKALIYMGLPHVVTTYKIPLLKVNNDDFCDYETGFVGNRLQEKYPDKITNIMFHVPMLSKEGHSPALLSPGDGMIEYLMYKNDYTPVGFDLRDSPLGNLKDNSYYSLCYPDFRMGDFFDGYLFLQPFRRMEGCSIDTLFFEGQSWSVIKQNMPDPDWHTANNLSDYREQIKAYVNIKERYADLWPGGLPELTYGTIDRYKDFPSAYVASRNVDVWLPHGYDKNKRYEVLYMHDGQMLFDPATTWNKRSWKLDQNIGELLATNKIRDCIVVGIWSIGESRYQDYFPEKAINYLSQADKTTFLEKFIISPLADNYLKFLVMELKPYIDANYSTFSEPEKTWMAGSSMGGLISLYGLCEYPDVFGGVACLSIHTPMVISYQGTLGDGDVVPAAFRKYLMEYLPPVNSKRIYMDYGDQTLDAYYAPFQKEIDNLLQKKGWKKPYWETLFFPGTDHSEDAWSARLPIPLQFLLGNK